MQSGYLVGIIGGGQLGRMLALAGYPLGLRFRVLDPKPDAPAGVVGEHIVGNYDDPEALQRLAAGAEVVTYEFENVPVDAARLLSQTVPVFPPPAALATAQDRLIEKQFFRDQGIPTATFVGVENRASFNAALSRFGLPAVLKTRRMGYDGKGQMVIRSQDDGEQAWERFGGGTPLILESLVPFERELSLLAVRGRDGAIVFYPLIENTHRDGILHRSVAPAPNLAPTLQGVAEGYATRVLHALDYVGVLAIEFFQFGGGLLANEMAPRVHNSGHWTIEGAETSQFANHLRAILGWPLGPPAPIGVSLMENIIGSVPNVGNILANPRTHLHLYGKSPRPGRKLGHITTRDYSP